MSASKCKKCGENVTATGNYTFKIVPAKRIPNKGRKLLLDGSLQKSSCGTSSFQKFLLKRSVPANIMELTCGTCGEVTKFKMNKPLLPMEVADTFHSGDSSRVSNLDSSSTSVAVTPGSSKMKKKNYADSSAGLTLPVSSSESISPKPGTTAAATSASTSNKTVSTFKRKKDMNNLKNILFNSKKSKKGGSSLQDFLSGI